MKRKIIVATFAVLLIPAAFLVTKNGSINGTLDGFDGENSIKPIAQTDSKLHGLPLPNPTAPDTNTILASDFKRMQQDMALLRNELAALRAKESKSTAEKSTSKTDASYENLPPEQIRQQEALRQAKETESIELSFKQQTKDQNWSDKATSDIQQAFTNAQVASDDVLSIDCRVTMCRVEVVNDAEQGKTLEKLSMDVGTKFPNIRADQEEMADGSHVTVLYLSKDDFVYPDKGS